MHPLMSLWREGWSSLHPNWTMKLWSECRGQVTALECNGEILDSSFPTQLQGSCNLSQRTNIWRYELLERFGGLYLDTDFEPVKNIEPIIESSESFAGLGLSFYPGETQIRANCALIGCTPHHPWMQDLVENIKTRDPSILLSLGVAYFHEITMKHPEGRLFEPDVFYSHRYDHPTHYKPPMPAGAYAVHHWSSKWYRDSFKQLDPSQKQ